MNLKLPSPAHAVNVIVTNRSSVSVLVSIVISAVALSTPAYQASLVTNVLSSAGRPNEYAVPTDDAT